MRISFGSKRNKKLRTACLVPTSNICPPLTSTGTLSVLVEARSNKYVIAQLMIPACDEAAARRILDAVQR